MTSSDDNHTHLPASDECARAALIAAMAECPELDGSKLRRAEAGPNFAIVLPQGKEVRPSEFLRRDTFRTMTASAVALVRKAVEVVREAQADACSECARLGPPQCADSVCSECGALGVEHEAKPKRFSQQPEAKGAATGERTPLPEGWTWHPSTACCADGPGHPCAYIGVESESGPTRGQLFSGGDIPLAVREAVKIEAARLGLREPAGYRFINGGALVCVYSSDSGGYLGAVYSDGDNTLIGRHPAAIAWARWMMAKRQRLC